MLLNNIVVGLKNGENQVHKVVSDQVRVANIIDHEI